MSSHPTDRHARPLRAARARARRAAHRAHAEPRLAQALEAEFDRAQLAAGLASWDAPDIIALRRLRERAATRRRSTDGRRRRPAGAAVARRRSSCCGRRPSQPGIGPARSSREAATAALAADAWTLAHDMAHRVGARRLAGQRGQRGVRRVAGPLPAPHRARSAGGSARGLPALVAKSPRRGQDRGPRDDRALRLRSPADERARRPISSRVRRARASEVSDVREPRLAWRSRAWSSSRRARSWSSRRVGHGRGWRRSP